LNCTELGGGEYFKDGIEKMEHQALRDATKDDVTANAANFAIDLHAMNQANSTAAPEYHLAAGTLPQITVGKDTEHGDADTQSRLPTQSERTQAMAV